MENNNKIKHKQIHTYISLSVSHSLPLSPALAFPLTYTRKHMCNAILYIIMNHFLCKQQITNDDEIS